MAIDSRYKRRGGFCGRTEKICFRGRCRSRRTSLLLAEARQRHASSGARRIVEEAACRISPVHGRGRTREPQWLSDVPSSEAHIFGASAMLQRPTILFIE